MDRITLAPVRFVEAPDATPQHVEAARWALMLSLSLEVRGWLVGTRNRTEEELGTFSLASRVATFLPLAGLWKSEVMAACAHVGVPGEILESSRRADPSCGRPQEMVDLAVVRERGDEIAFGPVARRREVIAVNGRRNGYFGSSALHELQQGHLSGGVLHGNAIGGKINIGGASFEHFGRRTLPKVGVKNFLREGEWFTNQLTGGVHPFGETGINLFDHLDVESHKSYVVKR